MTVWAFAQVGDDGDKAKEKIVKSLKKDGVSRFGWSQDDTHNLLLEDNWTDWHSKSLFLMDIKKGDWIVHINTPSYGRCIAVQVEEEYSFDSGIDVYDNGEWIDFRHCFKINKNTLIEFDRHDSRIDPRINLRPRQRYHRIYAINEFVESIKRIRNDDAPIERNTFLHTETNEYLEGITKKIHEMYQSKKLEDYLADVFRRFDFIDVVKNGKGWGTDHGADLILTLRHDIFNIPIENQIVVQVKSYEGQHNDIKAVNDIKKAIEKYNANAGIIITTAESTETLEKAIQKAADDLNKQIYLISGKDVAKFVIQQAPDLVFNYK